MFSNLKMLRTFSFKRHYKLSTSLLSLLKFNKINSTKLGMHTSTLLTNTLDTTCPFISFPFSTPLPLLSLLTHSSFLCTRIRYQSPAHGMQTLNHISNPLSFYATLLLPPQISENIHFCTSIIIKKLVLVMDNLEGFYWLDHLKYGDPP